MTCRCCVHLTDFDWLRLKQIRILTLNYTAEHSSQQLVAVFLAHCVYSCIIHLSSRVVTYLQPITSFFAASQWRWVSVTFGNYTKRQTRCFYSFFEHLPLSDVMMYPLSRCLYDLDLPHDSEPYTAARWAHGAFLYRFLSPALCLAYMPLSYHVVRKHIQIRQQGP